MKKVIIILVVLVVVFSSCISTPKITQHNDEVTIIRYGKDIYSFPTDSVIHVDLENGIIEEIK